MRRALTSLSLLAAVLAAVLSASASASHNVGFTFGGNVDPSLVTTIDQGQSGSGDRFHLLVFGLKPDLGRADSSAGVSMRNDLALLGAQSVTVTAAQAAVIAAQKGITFVTSDTPMAPQSKGSGKRLPAPTPTPPASPRPAPPASPAMAPAPSSSPLSTLYPQIDGASSVWPSGDNGAGVGVAVIDSGVTPRADFGKRLVQVELPAQDGTALADNVGHGSAVAGAAAGSSPDGKYVGVAPGASVYAINVARADGVYTSDVIAGINWVLQNAKADNIRVVNLSLSQTTPSSYFTSTLDAAVDQLWRQGIVVVTASGNFGPDTEQFAPANDPWVISVGAADSNDTLATSDDTLAEFSSFGTTVDGFSKPEIVAPGRHIVTTIPADSTIAESALAGYLVGSGEENYVRISGTSFAAPQVSGAVALLLQKNSNLTPDQVKWVLTQSERPLTGSDAGALDIPHAAALAARAASANGGYRWSSWAKDGWQTSDYLGASTGTIAIVADELNAARIDLSAQTTCSQAGVKAASVSTASNLVSSMLSTTGTSSAALAPLTSLPGGSSSGYAACARQLETAAAAWDNAAQEWGDVGLKTNAAIDERRAASDWQDASSGWTSAGNAQNASADAATEAAAWDKAAAWDAAAWDAAAWDAAAWDKAAAWDHTAGWDAAAWDAAAWDAAAWDAAAWD